MFCKKFKVEGLKLVKNKENKDINVEKAAPHFPVYTIECCRYIPYFRESPIK